jgi:polar amino acid transport system substrate-binding protein
MNGENMLQRLIGLVAISLMCVVGALHAAPLKCCYEDVPQRPWTYPDDKGLNFSLLSQVEKQLGEKFEYVSLPWKRCLAYVNSGTMDGVIGATFSPERLEFGVFPMGKNAEERVAARL